MLSVIAIDLLIIDESYPNALLVTKARKLRHQTGNWSLHATHEEWDASFGEMVNKYMVRPIRMLSSPICFSLCLYVGFIYALIYL